MSVVHDYEVAVIWAADRRGTLSATGLDKTIDVATPPQFTGGMEGLWSPEHLFVAAINSCLMTTFLAIADNSKLDFLHFDSKAAGRLEMVEGKYIMSTVTLRPVLTIADEGQRGKAEQVLQKSERHCLISNSVRSTIIFEPQVCVHN